MEIEKLKKANKVLDEIKSIESIISVIKAHLLEPKFNSELKSRCVTLSMPDEHKVWSVYTMRVPSVEIALKNDLKHYEKKLRELKNIFKSI